MTDSPAANEKRPSPTGAPPRCEHAHNPSCVACFRYVEWLDEQAAERGGAVEDPPSSAAIPLLSGLLANPDGPSDLRPTRAVPASGGHNVGQANVGEASQRSVFAEREEACLGVTVGDGHRAGDASGLLVDDLPGDAGAVLRHASRLVDGPSQRQDLLTPCLYGRDPRDCSACQEAEAITSGKGFYAVLNLHRPDDWDCVRCGTPGWWIAWSDCPEVARVRTVIEAAS